MKEPPSLALGSLARSQSATRRSCLGIAGAVAASAALARPSRAQPVIGLPSLREEAAAKGLRYGAHPYNYPPHRTPDLDQLVAEQCGLVAPVLNWPLVSLTQDAFDSAADKGVVALAEAQRMLLTGAHLLWFAAVPGWFRALSGPDAARAAIEAHIRRMGAAFASRTWSVNVINEALNPGDQRTDGLRIDPFLQAVGPGYWDTAFQAARVAFPDSLLVYNDTGMEQDGGDMLARRRALLDRIDALLKRGTPVDAVGLQSHLTLTRPFDPASYRAFLADIAGRGLKVVVSELDVTDDNAAGAEATGTIEDRDRAAAAMYRRYLDAALAEPAVAAVVTWGLSDRQSWITARRQRWFLHRGRPPPRTLPFDADLNPKPAFDAIIEAFRAAPQRQLR